MNSEFCILVDSFAEFHTFKMEQMYSLAQKPYLLDHEIKKSTII